MTDLFNASQLNSLVLTLLTFEDNLRQADAWLQGKEEYGILYQRRLSLPPGQRKAASTRIADALKQIADLASRLDLQSIEEDLVRLIRGQLSVDLANLMDTKSSTLGRYGKVDPRLTEVLDPFIDRLAQMALDLARMFDSQEDQTG
jgi:hypothetical protein